VSILNKKNPKKLIIVLVILVVLVAAAFLIKSKGVKTTGLSGGSVFNSIEDAIAKSLSLKCEYKVGENTTIAYVKGNSVKIEGSWEGNNSSIVIMKDNKLWTWDTVKKEGVILPLDMGEEEESTTGKDIIGGIEAQREFCKVSVFSDSIFDVPTDVKFQDLGDLQNLVIPTPGG